MYHKSQIFFYLLLAFVCGVFLASLFNFSQTLIWTILVVTVGVVMVAGEKKIILLIAIMSAFFVVGVIRFNQFDSSKDSLEKFIDKEVVLTGYVDGEPKINENLQRFALRVNEERILVTVNGYPRYKFGDFVQVSGKLELPQNFSDDFDYITYLKRDSVKTILFFPKISIYKGDLNLAFWEKLRLSLYKKIFVVKNKFQTAINLSVPEPNAAFINGILLGSRQNIPDGLKEAFNKMGTIHILAISGYNIMIIFWAVLEGLIYFFRRRVAFWTSIMIIVLFVILTGASASVVRAATMGLLLSFAHGYGRLYDQKNSIILTGAVMIYHNPMVLVFDIGFQLSFAAVLGLIYLYPKLKHLFYKVPELWKLKELTLMTVSAQIAVAPLLIYYFGSFSSLSLVANVLILPFIPAAMLTGFMAGFVGIVFPFFGSVVGYIAWAITTYQIEVVKYFSLW